MFENICTADNGRKKKQNFHISIEKYLKNSLFIKYGNSYILLILHMNKNIS